jgi:hypothetical protein
MTRAARGLEHARRLYRARRFQEVLRLLEPQIFRFRSDARYYALLGLSCLHTGEIGGAATYLGRASQLDDQDPETLTGLAVVHLRRHEPESAVACWLRVLDLDPGNRIAQRGLDAVRRAGATVPAELTDPEALRPFLPRLPNRFPWRALLAAAIVAVVAGGGFAVFRLATNRLSVPSRPGIEEILLPTDRPEVVVLPGSTLVTFTERELVRAFARAKRYLLEYRDNLAVRELNRILLSNASAGVKEKAQLLRSFAEEPDFSTIRDPFSYQEVTRSPLEYADCFVRWSGRTANVSIGEEQITFDLLVGYQDGRVLEGVVRVLVAFAVAVDEGGAYEVLGRVLVTDAPGVRLAAVSIRPIDSRSGASR